MTLEIKQLRHSDHENLVCVINRWLKDINTDKVVFLSQKHHIVNVCLLRCMYAFMWIQLGHWRWGLQAPLQHRCYIPTQLKLRPHGERFALHTWLWSWRLDAWHMSISGIQRSHCCHHLSGSWEKFILRPAFFMSPADVDAAKNLLIPSRQQTASWGHLVKNLKSLCDPF